MAEIELKTALEKEREARHEEVCELYKSFREKHPNIKPSKLFVIVGMEIGMSDASVRNICINRGLYKPKNAL